MELIERQHAVKFDTEVKKGLQRKLQVEQDQKAKFQAIVAANQDSFNANMIAEMPRCVATGQNMFHLTMVEEQAIVDNLAGSERWFTEYFQKLKNDVFSCKGGGAMDNVDFKDYEQILSAVQPNDNETPTPVMPLLLDVCKEAMESSEQLQLSAKPGRIVKLVCAAKNLLASLEKCHAMIMAQRHIGVGPFADHLVKDERDLGKVIEICQRFKALGFAPVSKGSQFCEVFTTIEQLMVLVGGFTSAFGPLASIEGCL